MSPGLSQLDPAARARRPAAGIQGLGAWGIDPLISAARVRYNSGRHRLTKTDLGFATCARSSPSTLPTRAGHRSAPTLEVWSMSRQTRRDFLRASAAATSGGILLPWAS